MANTIIKFTDNTAIVGLISEEDETGHRDEVQRLSEWCSVNNPTLNTTKTTEMILDFRRKRDTEPLHINGEKVERVQTFKFLGVHVSEDLSWSPNTTVMLRKAQQRLHFFRVLRRNNMEKKLLVAFYQATTERPHILHPSVKMTTTVISSCSPVL